MRAKKKYKSGGTVSRSARYYQENPESRKKKAQYDTKYHSTPSRRKYRSFLNKKNREAGTYGNGDGKDWDHGVRRMIKASTNRAKKMQEGGTIPKFKPFQNQMDKSLFYSQYRAEQARRIPSFGINAGPIHALKPSFPVFDLLAGGTFLKQGVKPAFNLMKSTPTFMQKHGKKIYTALSTGEAIEDFKEMNE